MSSTFTDRGDADAAGRMSVVRHYRDLNRGVAEYVVKILRGIYFFFQAEDGIRDGRVTGVQTCALPISVTIEMSMTTTRMLAQQIASTSSRRRRLGSGTLMSSTLEFRAWSKSRKRSRGPRSEERRVGKECR